MFELPVQARLALTCSCESLEMIVCKDLNLCLQLPLRRPLWPYRKQHAHQRYLLKEVAGNRENTELTRRRCNQDWEPSGGFGSVTDGWSRVSRPCGTRYRTNHSWKRTSVGRGCCSFRDVVRALFVALFLSESIRKFMCFSLRRTG